MARRPRELFLLYSPLAVMQTGLLQLILVVTALAERCTRAVPVQSVPAKKMHVLRRVPASCSNWDKAWAWLTKVDCGTKYRLDLVTVPPQEVKQYKLQYFCCDGDTDCDPAGVQSSGFDTTDEKFLAIVLGSTAACVVIIIIIFAITFYTKKTRCLPLCAPDSHTYSSAADGDSQDGNEGEKSPPDDLDSECEQKACEAEYAEIGDSRLPRYTDIFKENMEEKGDPFNKATAPPLYSEVNRKGCVTSSVRAPPSLHSSLMDEIHVLPAESPTHSEGADDVFEGQHAPTPGDSKYYNVREKKRKKKSSQGGSTSSSKGERRGVRRNRPSVPSFEMMVKSSSASETIGKPSAASVTRHKRRSAPLDSVDVYSGMLPSAPPQHSSSHPLVTCTSSTCSVIHEAPKACRSSERRHRTRSSRENVTTVTRSSRQSCDYENCDVTSPGACQDAVTSHQADIDDATNNSVSISPSNGAVINCCDAASLGIGSLESESPQPSEKDSLLRSPSCHSGCGSEPGSCEHCSIYDQLQYTSDTEAGTEHLYQCLEEVRRDRRALASSQKAGRPNGNVVRDEARVALPQTARC